MDETRGREERTEKKVRCLQGQLEKYEGRCARERHDVEIEASTSRYLQLKFTSQPLRRIFTMTKVKGENSVDLVLSVVDPMTGQVIFSGPESSMDVALVLVDAGLKGAETGNWKLEYLEDNIVTARRDRPQLLKGDTILKLDRGSAVVGNLKITDNSSWVLSGHFRLVARVTNGYFHGIRVKEAITDPFTVKECRLKGNQKHHPPRPEDHVWRLVGIAKNGVYHRRLKEKGIDTVRDFLKSLQENRNALRDEILKMPHNDWEETVNHAESCTPCGPIDQPSNPQSLQATDQVVEQQSIQAVYFPNIHINTFPVGSSNPWIQQTGGPSILEGQYIALQHSGDSTSTLREPLNDSGSYGTQNPRSIFQAPDTDSFHSKSKEIDYDIFMAEILNGSPLQVADHVDSANGCSNMPTDSTAEKHQAHLKWSTLIVAMAFSVRIRRNVAVSDKNIETC